MYLHHMHDNRIAWNQDYQGPGGSFCSASKDSIGTLCKQTSQEWIPFWDYLVVGLRGSDAVFWVSIGSKAVLSRRGWGERQSLIGLTNKPTT